MPCTAPLQCSNCTNTDLLRLVRAASTLTSSLVEIQSHVHRVPPSATNQKKHLPPIGAPSQLSLVSRNSSEWISFHPEEIIAEMSSVIVQRYSNIEADIEMARRLFPHAAKGMILANNRPTATGAADQKPLPRRGSRINHVVRLIMQGREVNGIGAEKIHIQPKLRSKARATFSCCSEMSTLVTFAPMPDQANTTSSRFRECLRDVSRMPNRQLSDLELKAVIQLGPR